MSRQTHDERGVIAIFLASVLGILLVTTTTFASRLAVSELNQAAQVDRSEQAYYAAEAGVEDAIRRIDAAPTSATIQQIFPNQFSGPTQPGDRYRLTGNTPSSAFPDAATGPILDNLSPDAYGNLSWRYRKVYQQASSFAGTQVKDESVEFDTSDLRRRCPTQNNDTNGADGIDNCLGGASIFSRYQGFEYCWKPDGTTIPRIEISDVSWQRGDINGTLASRKTMVNPGSNVNLTGNVNIRVTPSGIPGENCAYFQLNNPNDRTNNATATRYILRFKPIFPTAGAAQGTLAVKYRARIVESPTPASASQALYIPNSSYYIDVVGQSGDVKRRVIAKKQRSGRLIGIFDYVLYSGDPNTPLCKGGVNQTDSGVYYDNFANCNVTPTGNETAYVYPTPSYTTPYSTPYATPYSSPYATPYATPAPTPFNVALNKYAYSDQSYTNGYCSSSDFPKINDGSNATEFPQCEYGLRFGIQLGGNFNISQVKAHWGRYGCSPYSSCGNGYQYITGYNIWVRSADYGGWLQIASGGDPNSLETVINNNYTKVDYLFIDLRSSQEWLGFPELSATGLPS